MLLIHFITYCTYCIASMSMETPQILFTVIAKSSQCKQCELHSTINENNSSRKLCEESGHVKFLRRSLPLITPHAQRERGKVIGCGVHIYIYICLWTKKIFESYFRDRLTFSNICSRTSRRIYRLALPLRAPETLSSLSKSRISIFNAHLALFVRRMTSLNSIGKYCHLVN